MRRQWQDPDSPSGSPNKQDVPRINIRRHLLNQGSPVISSVNRDIQETRRNSQNLSPQVSSKTTSTVNNIATDINGTSFQKKQEISDSPSSTLMINNDDSTRQNFSARNGLDGREKKGFAAKLAAAAPYNFFLTAIRDSPPTHREPLSVCFHQLLDPSMGDLDSSLQINFMVELDWLMEQYKVFGHE